MEMFRVIPDPEECGSGEMAVASHPLLSGLLDGHRQPGDHLSSLTRSPEPQPPTERGCSSVANSSEQLLTGALDDTLKTPDLKLDPLSSLHASPEASKLTGDTDVAWSSGTKSPEYFDCGSEPEHAVVTEEPACNFAQKEEPCGDVVRPAELKPTQEPACNLAQKEEPCGDVVRPAELKPTQASHPEVVELASHPEVVELASHPEVVELADECDNENGKPAVPVRDCQPVEAGVRGERDDDVVVLSHTEGANRLQKEHCCADPPGIPIRDEKDADEVGDIVILEQTINKEGANRLQKEDCCADAPGVPSRYEKDAGEVGDIVILEPTINKEVPASICRESSAPRLYEECITIPDEPLEDRGTHSGGATGCTAVKPSQQSATRERRRSDDAPHSAVAARSCRRLAARRPRRRLTCSSCLELFSSRFQLIRHVFVHVDDAEPPPHVCVMCGEVFATEQEVADHHRSPAARCYAFVPVVKMRVKSAEGVWVCGTCQQTFQTEHQLAIHKAERHLRTVISACVSPTKHYNLTPVRAENRHGQKCKINGGGIHGLPRQESFQRNYKSKPGRPSEHLQETPHSNKPEATSAEPPGTKRGGSPCNLNGEPLYGSPDSRKPEMVAAVDVDTLQEVTQRNSLSGTPEMTSGESLGSIPDTGSKEILNEISESGRGDYQRILDVTPGENLQNKSGITPGEPGMTPDCPIESKPKKRRGRPPGSKNRFPMKPRAKKSKPISGELLNGTPEEAVGKPPHSVQVMRPAECTDRVLEVTPAVPVGVLDEMRPGAPLDRQYEMRSGEYLYDLVPGELPDRLHQVSLGEHIFGQHETGPREKFYSLHELTPTTSLDSNPDVTPRDKLHDTTHGEPQYRLHEMTTVEAVHRLHEMSPVEILYRNHENVPVSPLDRIPKIEPPSTLHELTPMDIHYTNSDCKYQESTPRSPLNTIPKVPSVEPFGAQSEMAPREPVHKLTEMAPAEPLHKLSEAETLQGPSEAPPPNSLQLLSEMEPRDPLHTLFEMATGDPFHTLFELEPGDSFSSPSKMLPGQPYNGVPEIAPGVPLNSKPEVAQGNLVNGIPRKRRGRPPGSRNRFPMKPRTIKPKTEPGESPGAASNGVPEILMGEPGEKKPDKSAGDGEKWPCHFCRQLFCSISGLKRHLVRHTGERNYVCDLCGKAFARSDNLRVHRYSHTGGLPFKCDVCGRAFSWACHLRDHKRKCQSS